MERILLSVKETAELCHVSKQTVYQWARQPGFPIIRRGRNSLIPAGLLRQAVNAQATAAKV